MTRGGYTSFVLVLFLLIVRINLAALARLGRRGFGACLFPSYLLPFATPWPAGHLRPVVRLTHDRETQLSTLSGRAMIHAHRYLQKQTLKSATLEHVLDKDKNTDDGRKATKLVDIVVYDAERTDDQKRSEMSQFAEMCIECDSLKGLLSVRHVRHTHTQRRGERTLPNPNPISSATKSISLVSDNLRKMERKTYPGCPTRRSCPVTPSTRRPRADSLSALPPSLAPAADGNGDGDATRMRCCYSRRRRYCRDASSTSSLSILSVRVTSRDSADASLPIVVSPRVSSLTCSSRSRRWRPSSTRFKSGSSCHPADMYRFNINTSGTTGTAYIGSRPAQLEYLSSPFFHLHTQYIHHVCFLVRQILRKWSREFFLIPLRPSARTIQL